METKELKKLIGKKIPTASGYIKIMAYNDNYYMARHRGCMPFVKSEKDMASLIISITSPNQLKELLK